MRTYTESEKLYDIAKTLAPAGVHSPVRAFKAVGGTPIFFDHGKGAKLTDVDGNEYLDFCMSWGALALGHAHPKVIEDICVQAQKGTHFGTPTAKDVALAKILCDIIPNADQIRFVNSGTEAVMTAVRLARGITERNKIVKIQGAYHGHLDSLLVSAGSGLVTQGLSSSKGVTPGTVEDTLVIPYDNIEALEKVFIDFKNDIAAVIIEPVLANNGLFEHKKEYLIKLREVCDKHQSLLIFDEVITGFRVALGGAQELYNIKADIMTYGKIIGGGLPIGAIAAKKEVLEYLAPTGPVYQAGTLSGNPIAMAAGLSSLNILMEENYYQHIDKIGAYFDEKIALACEKASMDFSFRRVKSLFWLCPGKSTPPSRSEEIDSDSVAAYKSLFHHMLEQSVYIAPSAFEVGFLSLCHKEQHIDQLARAIESI